jgi:hypothetical protein
VRVLSRFDAWVGLRLFHPPIIRFCQATGYTQYRLSRDMWFVAGLFVSWRAVHDGLPWWWCALLLFGAAAMGVCAAFKSPDRPESGRSWLRAFIWAGTIMSAPAVLDARPWELADNLWLLTAEYAVTIASIPPRKPRVTSKRRQRAPA